VASAKIVGPAPERQIPRRPGWVVGVRVDRILGRPGICLLAIARVKSEGTSCGETWLGNCMQGGGITLSPRKCSLGIDGDSDGDGDIGYITDYGTDKRTNGIR